MNKYLLISICFASVLIPSFASVFSSDIFGEAPFVFGMIVLCTFGLIIKSKQKCYLSVVDILFILFIFYGVFHFCVFPSKYADPLRLWEWVAAVSSYFFIRSIRDEEKKVLLYALIVSGVIQSIIVWGQLSGVIESRHPLFQITGSFGNPGQLGGYLAVCFVASLNYLKQSKKRFVVLLIAFLIVVIGGALLATDSRAAWIATVLGCCFAFWKDIHCFCKRYKKTCIFLVLIIGVLGSLFIYNYRPESANARMLIWRVCGEMIADKPLFGHGVGSFPKKYMLYQANYFQKQPDSSFISVADNVGYPYNEFLYVTVELGLIGFLMIAGLLVLLFSMRSQNDQERSFKSALICLIVFSLFSYPSYIFPLFLLFSILLGGSVSKELYTINKLRWVHTLFVLVIVGVCVWAVIECKFYERASWEMKQATSKKELESAPFINKHFGKLIHNLKFNAVYTEYIFHYGADDTDYKISYLTPSCETYCDIGKVYCRRKEFAKAESYYKLASWMIPTRILPNYLLWQLYVNTGDQVNAKDVAGKILSQQLKVDNTVTIRVKAEVRTWLNEHD
ncbi:O-antigen ligase [Bacteroides sp. 51]|uniref:O-antigen ligase family protein n=1 Tax=Bacteroides sp. 51 TaxID=2302938 RepID=UPI0013D69A2F|nr:O-antigen ligase [Bacteroides sp. 51]